MADPRIGYAKVSTAGQDLTVQRQALAGLGVDPRRAYVDHGLTGTNREERPGIREALAACRTGDPLVVAKLDRLARSAPDARDIVDELTSCRGAPECRRVLARPGRHAGCRGSERRAALL